MAIVNFDQASIVLVGNGANGRKRWHVQTDMGLTNVSDVPTATHTVSVQSPELPFDGTMQKYYATPADVSAHLIPLNSDFGWGGIEDVVVNGFTYQKFRITPQHFRVINTNREDVTHLIDIEDANNIFVYLYKDDDNSALSATRQHEGYLKVNYFGVEYSDSAKPDLLIRGNGVDAHGFLDLELQTAYDGYIYGNIIPPFMG